MNFNNFTIKAQEAVQKASEIAVGNQQQAIETAHLLKGSKATILTEIGLIDITCPATSVYAAINQAGGKKTIFTVPYREHHAPQNFNKELWEKSVNQHREQFIADYLK